MSDAEDAWIVQQYLLGRSQRELGDDLGTSNSAICVRVGRFCDKWSGTIVTNGYIYNAVRKRFAALALQKYFAHGGKLMMPYRVRTGQLDLWFDYADAGRDDFVGPREDDWGYDLYWKARNEHAWLLRAEGLNFAVVGRRLGVSRTRSRQMVAKHARRMRWATRRACFRWQ